MSAATDIATILDRAILAEEEANAFYQAIERRAGRLAEFGVATAEQRDEGRYGVDRSQPAERLDHGASGLRGRARDERLGVALLGNER